MCAFPSDWSSRISLTGYLSCAFLRVRPPESSYRSCCVGVCVQYSWCSPCSGIALIGYGFGRVSPNQRPFSLTDPSISFPHRDHDTVSVSVVAVVALIVPAVIIVLGALVLIPFGPAMTGHETTIVARAKSWRYKLWEWNAGWLGLGISLAGAYMATEGLKDLFGKPRPDMLARCDPDLSKIGNFAVSGLGSRLDGAPTLVTWEICRNQARELAVDGFSSFPSGHSSCK